MSIPQDFAVPAKPTSELYGTAMGLEAESQLRAIREVEQGSGISLSRQGSLGVPLLGILEGFSGLHREEGMPRLQASGWKSSLRDCSYL